MDRYLQAKLNPISMRECAGPGLSQPAGMSPEARLVSSPPFLSGEQNEDGEDDEREGADRDAGERDLPPSAPVVTKQSEHSECKT